MGKAKGKGGSAAPTAPPKCICDHPFQCDCGNRPERPSKGHKWYPADQIWAGKGHKQKGASGQVSSVSEQAKITATGKTQVSQWQRLPSQLLEEVCKKQGRLTPKYKNVGGNAAASANSVKSYKCRVILCDPRDSEKDLFFTPAHAVANEEQAKEEGALLALLQLTPSLPHERKLPEPYKTTWLNAIQSQKANAKPTSKSVPSSMNNATERTKVDEMNLTVVTSATATSSSAVASSNLVMAATYSSSTDRRRQIEERRRLQNARIRKHDAIRMANRNHPVFMSAFMRKQVERLLRGDSQGCNEENTFWSADSDDEDDNTMETNPASTADGGISEEGDALVYVVHRLRSEGFSKRPSRAAYQEVVKQNPKFHYVDQDEVLWDQLYEQCLQWLLVHLNEDQLPEGFDPRGRTLDVILPTTSVPSLPEKLQSLNSTPAGSGKSINDTSKEFAGLHGITLHEASLVVELALKENVSPVDVFMRTVKSAAGVNELAAPVLEGKGEITDILKDEMEALSAIFDTDCNISSNDNGYSLVCLKLDDGGLTLEITVHDVLYPSVRPNSVVVFGDWSSKVGVALHIELAKFTEELPMEEPMIFAIHAHAQDLVQSGELGNLSLLAYFRSQGGTLNQKLPKTNEPMPKTEKVSVKDTMGSTATQTRRYRSTKKTFWSIHPRDTPPAIALPKVGFLMDRTRKSLPAAAARTEFLAAMKTANKQGTRVVLVTGETGSGKTTQLPAYILEDNPGGAKVVVVQPRRLAATGVANRVAEERGERNPGVDSVGYVVRGDSAICPRSRLVFCTTGVLLRQLQNECALDCLTTIVVDEVHERNLDGDVLLGLLKQLLPANPHLSVVLMSATLETQRFQNYWSSTPVPHVHIPGRTFPVTDFMLEDVLRLTGFIPSKNKGSKTRMTHRGQRSSPWNDSEKSDDENELDKSVNDKDEKQILSLSTRQHGISINDLVKRMDETKPDADLICRLVKFIVMNKDPSDDGSILIFLAGAPEINDTLETIKRGLKNLPIVLFPLHGGLQPKEQNRVFQPAQRGFTKVILSTNVAETSVTIPDCTVVIDTGREKQASYDPANRMPQLVEQFASKAAMKQRRGRAGRVREGTCYKLISFSTHEALKEHSDPEITRVALDQTLLQLMFLGVERGTGTFTSTLLDPPSKDSIDAAIFSLKKLGAIEPGRLEGEMSLTSLGVHLAGIPAPPTIGKLLVMGSILGCREAAVVMAAGISVGRSPFIRVDTRTDKTDFASESREVSTEKSKVQDILDHRAPFIKEAGNSDHALLVSVFLKWKGTEMSLQRNFCESIGLNVHILRDISQQAKQLDSTLISLGFVASSVSDRHGTSLRILHACAVAAMSPSQLVKVRRPATKYLETAEGAKEKDGEARELKFFVRTGNEEVGVSDETLEERVFIHPSSTNFQTGTYSCPFLVYHSLVRTSKPFLRDVTECSAYAMLLFGGDLEIRASQGIVVIDEWATLSTNARIGSLMGGLRRRMDVLLADKIKNPSLDIANSQEMMLIAKLVMTDGLGT